jgi:hypothetical protein
MQIKLSRWQKLRPVQTLRPASGYDAAMPASPPSPFQRKAVLRVQVLMAEHDIRFVTDLWKRLTAMGVDISHSQLTRVVNNSTKSLSIDLLEGLATLFDCPVSSLFKDN